MTYRGFTIDPSPIRGYWFGLEDAELYTGHGMTVEECKLIIDEILEEEL